jgi:putative ABC transport system permease protein
MRALLDEDRRHIPVPGDGLLLSRKLAEMLDLTVGDLVEVRVQIGRRPRVHARVERLVDDYLGVWAYADHRVLSRWIGEDDVIDGALLRVDPDRLDEVGGALKQVPAVSAVALRRDTLDSLERSIGESQAIMYGVLILFAGILAFGVTYNTARISLAERQRELGSMRVLGYSTREVAALLTGENLLLAGLGVVPGTALGVLFAWLLSRSFETDLYRWPFVMRPGTAVQAVVAVLAFALLANLLVVTRMRRMDLVEVLKARE